MSREQRWRYTDPDGTTEMSEAEILKHYYPYWCEQMKRVGKAQQISEQACIEDWVIVHWAEKVTP